MRIIFSAGGTGGHLYPALALANYLQEYESAQILFVGSSYRIEATKVEEYGYDFHGLDIKTPSGNIIKKTRGYLDVFTNIKKCEKIIKKFQPDIVIGFGGYTSFSMIKAAYNLGVPTILHEQNSVLGKSNKLLAKRVNALISAYDLSEQYQEDNLYCLGNPTSYQVQLLPKANLNDYELDDDKKTVLIFMGSQGSMIIDKVISKMLDKITNDEFQVIYLSGEAYYQNYDNKNYPDNIKVLAYDNQLVSLIKKADLIISRAGASALTEIISANKPSILIPSIHVTNNHQVKNAQHLEDAGASIIIAEEDLNEDVLLENITSILQDDVKLTEMSTNTKKFNYDDSAKNISNLIKEVVGDYHGK